MATAVIYARISKDDQGDHLGVDRQERACRELAATRGLDVLDVLVDNDISASNGRTRPAFERLVTLLGNREAGAVLSYHADRLYRRTADLERLVKMVETSGAQVHTVAAGDVDLGTASGRMVARMLGAASQHEVERLGERLKMKFDELAAKGSAPGGRAPFGYSREWPHKAGGEKVGGHYVINPTEAAALKMMARRVLQGASLLAVARELDAAGVKTREGRPWHHATVRATLVNPAVAGLRVHRREIAGPGEWPAILDRATWEEVRAVLADPARKRTRPARSYLLTGLVFNTTGDAMVGRPDRAADGSLTRRCYATRSPSVTSSSIGADDLEALIVEAVLVRSDNVALPELEVRPGPGGAVVALEAELAELAELRGAGTISLAEWMAARAPLQERLLEARAAAGSAPRQNGTSQLLKEPGAVRRAWPTRDFAGRREIVAAVVDRITVKPSTRGRWASAAERVDDIIWKV